MLNSEQQLAVNTHAGYLLTLACPGSGKTLVIVERVLSLIRSGVDPRDILSLTFTAEASREMKNRVGRLLLNLSSTARVSQARLDAVSEYHRLATPRGHHVFATFHSFALRLIKAERNQIPGLRDMPIASSSDVSRALRIAMTHTTGMRRKDLQSYISRMKRTEITAPQALVEADGEYARAYAQAYSRYEAYMTENGCLDYDSLLTVTANLLRTRTDIGKRWQVRYLQIDEAQDTDPLQWTIVSLLSKRFQNLFAVGDENQGMYSFRGAESELEKNFHARWPEAAVLILPENYRSTQAIVEHCKAIAPIKNATVEQFRTSNEQGIEPIYWLHPDDEVEANTIVASLENPATTAILARTNAQLMWFEDACQARGIKYQLLGKSGFWRRYEIENAIAYVRAMLTQQENAVVKVIRSPYAWTRVTKDAKDAAIEYIKKAERPLGILQDYKGPGYQVLSDLPRRFAAIRYLKAASTGEGLRMLLASAGIFDYYQRDDEEERDPDNNPEANLQKLIRVADKMSSLYDFILFTEKVKRAPRASKESLTLSTIHKAKGLQWPTVVVAGVTKDVLPHKMGDPDEEARIYYVACSRPEKKLIISAYGTPSIFFKVEAAQQIEPPKSLFTLMEDLS